MYTIYTMPYLTPQFAACESLRKPCGNLQLGRIYRKSRKQKKKNLALVRKYNETSGLRANSKEPQELIHERNTKSIHRMQISGLSEGQIRPSERRQRFSGIVPYTAEDEGEEGLSIVEKTDPWFVARAVDIVQKQVRAKSVLK